MSPVEAVNYLRELQRREPDVRMALTKMCARAGHADIYAWAAADEPGIMQVAEELRDVYGQLEAFAERLRTTERENYRP